MSETIIIDLQRLRPLHLIAFQPLALIPLPTISNFRSAYSADHIGNLPTPRNQHIDLPQPRNDLFPARLFLAIEYVLQG